jgi:hypothetical protein
MILHPIVAQAAPGNLLPTTPGAGALNIPGTSGWTNQIVDAASNQIAQGWDQAWTNALSGPLYGILARLGLMIAGFVIIFFVFQFARNMLDDATNRPLAELIWPIVIVVFLSNNGALLSGLTLGMRGFINAQNSQILSATTAGLNAQEALNRIASFQSAQAQLSGLQTACDQVRDNTALQSCFDSVKSRADQILQQEANRTIGGAWGLRLREMAQSITSNPAGALVGAGQVAITSSIRAQSFPAMILTQTILIAAQIAFQHLIEASMLLTALMGPIAMGASLLPFGAKPIWAWLTAFWSVGLCKMALNILSGLIAQSTYQSGPTDISGLVMPIVLGLLSPILAMAMASGGGLAIFNGMTGAANTVVSLATLGVVSLKK